MNKCCRCNKRIWPWKKEGNSPVKGTNRRDYFHLITCYPKTIWKRICAWLYEWAELLIPLVITGIIVGGGIAVL